LTGSRRESLKTKVQLPLFAKAMVTKHGAVLLGNHVACDAHDDHRPVRVVTHAHADHLAGLRTSVKKCEKVLMTKATRDLIEVIEDPDALAGDNVKTLDYGKATRYGDEKITLLYADHIVGAAQVLVEESNGARVGYTGDFRLDGTPALECDTLVVEATYGDPSCRRSFGVDVHKVLVSLVERQLKDGTVYVFGYHGKLQEVMQILHDADVSVPFVTSERVFRMAKVCERHGMRLGCLTMSSQPEAREMLNENLPCVAFYHMNARGTVGLGGSRICVSGWEFRSACRQISDNEHVVALSDHSDFDGLVEYVRRSKPKRVITDNYRSYGGVLAIEIRRRLGIPAVAMPMR
jgi:putative mRNA 3-end processing factor